MHKLGYIWFKQRLLPIRCKVIFLTNADWLLYVPLEKLWNLIWNTNIFIHKNAFEIIFLLQP